MQPERSFPRDLPPNPFHTRGAAFAEAANLAKRGRGLGKFSTTKLPSPGHVFGDPTKPLIKAVHTLALVPGASLYDQVQQFRGYIEGARQQQRQRAAASRKGVEKHAANVREDDKVVIEAVRRFRKKHGRRSRDWPTSKMIRILRAKVLVDYSERRLRNIFSRLGLK